MSGLPDTTVFPAEDMAALMGVGVFATLIAVEPRRAAGLNGADDGQNNGAQQGRTQTNAQPSSDIAAFEHVLEKSHRAALLYAEATVTPRTSNCHMKVR